MIRHFNKCPSCGGLHVIVLELDKKQQPNGATHSIVCVQCGKETQVKLEVVEEL